MEKTRATRTRAPRARNRREAIVLAAVECYSRIGVPGTQLNEIARAAKVDPPLIHYYFPKPESLLLEAIQKIQDELRDQSLEAMAAARRNPASMLEAYTRSYFGWAHRNPGKSQVWLYFYYRSTTEPRFREMSGQIRDAGRERIAGLVYEGVESGAFEIPPGFKVKDLATAIQAMILGAAVMTSTEPGRDAEADGELAWRSIRAWLKAR